MLAVIDLSSLYLNVEASPDHSVTVAVTIVGSPNKLVGHISEWKSKSVTLMVNGDLYDIPWQEIEHIATWSKSKKRMVKWELIPGERYIVEKISCPPRTRAFFSEKRGLTGCLRLTESMLSGVPSVTPLLSNSHLERKTKQRQARFITSVQSIRSIKAEKKPRQTIVLRAPIVAIDRKLKVTLDGQNAHEGQGRYKTIRREPRSQIAPDLQFRAVQLGTKDEVLIPRANDRIAIIHFWATFCYPCREEIPHISKFIRSETYQRLSEHGVKLYVVSLDSPQTAWAQIIRELKSIDPKFDPYQTYRVEVGHGPGELDILNQLTGQLTIPTTAVLVSGETRPREVWVGSRQWSPYKINRLLTKMLRAENARK